MMKARTFLAQCLLALIFATILAASSSVGAAESTGSVVTKTFTTTSTEFPNPERGWYQFASDTAPYINSPLTASDMQAQFNANFRITFARINLASFKTSNIPQSELDKVSAGFAALRSGGIKAILRIVYNYDSSGSDPSLSQALTHIQQLAPYLKANADVIAYVQAGMIGAWGEWHDSQSMCPGTSPTAACWLATINALLAATDPRTPIQVRYPKFLPAWWSTPIGKSVKFSGSPQSRVGSHNDCFMSDNTDVGTYQSTVLTLANPERARVANDSNWTPFGGETCSGFSPTRLGCSTASGIKLDGPTYHLTYLNRYFYTAFHESWSSGGCFNEVERSIGYRFVLDSFTMQGTALVGQSITATLDLHNEGWSRIFSARRINVTLRNTSTNETKTCISDQDLRSVDPQTTAGTATRFTIRCNLGTTSAGTYEVSLSAPDVWPTTATNTRFAVRFANQDSTTVTGQSWDATNARMRTGISLVIS